MPEVQRRVLEHLCATGALLVVGCREPQPTSAATDPPATATTATAPTATATIAAPSDSAAPTLSEVDGPCKTADDCKPGLQCRLGFDGANFSETGVCTTTPPIYRGRPLQVGGEPRVSTLVGAAAVREHDAWAAYFARAAVEEHASIAAFARTVCQLMALGAPIDLLERTQRAMADEIDHARGSLEWLAHFGGGTATPGPLREAVSPLTGQSSASPEQLATELFIDVVHGGCVGEALAAEAMLERAHDTSHPALSQWLERVADDEARHAALAFETATWLVRAYPSLAPTAQLEYDRLSDDARRSVGPLFEVTGLASLARTDRPDQRPPLC